MRERFHVKIARRAEIDLEEIWDYIAADSVENATRFIVELETRMKTLSYSPRRCSLIPENEILGTRYRHLIIRSIESYLKSAATRSTFCELFTEQDCWIPR